VKKQPKKKTTALAVRPKKTLPATRKAPAQSRRWRVRAACCRECTGG